MSTDALYHGNLAFMILPSLHVILNRLDPKLKCQNSCCHMKMLSKDKIAFASSRKTLHFKVQSSLISGFIYLLPKFVRHEINAADMRLMWL